MKFDIKKSFAIIDFEITPTIVVSLIERVKPFNNIAQRIFKNTE